MPTQSISRRVLVTGGSGFIGTNLVEWCREQGDLVVNFDNVPPRNPAHAPLWRKVDILDRSALNQSIMEFNPEFVFHMAARTDLYGRSVREYEANIDGVGNLIESLRALPTLRLAVFASSMLVCRIGYSPRNEVDYCPNTAYGESKLLGEQLVRSEARESFPWIIVRPTSIWGPWFAALYRDFFTSISRSLYVHPAGMRIRRSYGFVLNCVFQLDHLAKTLPEALVGRTVYLADYDPTERKHWADAIKVQLGSRHVRELPLSLLKVPAFFGDTLKTLGGYNLR